MPRKKYSHSKLAIPSIRKFCHALIVEARFYPDIADMQYESVISFLGKHGANDISFERYAVPGCFEIPGAISNASKKDEFDIYIALGCLIRGETSHYDLICTAVTNGLMDLTINENLPLGFGILTCDNQEQAKKRASSSAENAANAALSMFKYQRLLRPEIFKSQ